MAGSNEHSFVADAKNWEDSVKSELSAAKNWSLNWGPLYNKGGGTTYAERIANAEKEKSEIPQNMMMQYPNMSREIGAKADQPFKEIKMTNSKMPKEFPDGLGEPVAAEK